MVALRKSGPDRALSAAVVALLAFGAAPALAAGAPAPATYTWTGVYVGANAGFSGGQATQVWDDGGVPYATDHAFASGLSGGAEVGLNFQAPASNMVVGVETDLQASAVEGTYADFGPDFHSGTKVDWFGTARGRLGLAVGNLLPYVTAGVAYGHLTNSYADSSTFPITYGESWSSTRFGWAVGAGVEDEVTHNVSVKLEYLYTQFGPRRSQDPQNAADPCCDTIHNTVNLGFSTARIGLNWKLN